MVAASVGVDTLDFVQLRDALCTLVPARDDVERIDRIRALEELKAAVAAAQARETAAFASSQRAEHVAAGAPAERVGRSIAGQVGLARRISPYQAARYVAWATVLTRDLPRTFAALAQGRTSEWRAMLVARETGWLAREHRAAVDADLAPRLAGLGDRRVEAEAKTAAYRLDPHGALRRVRGAEADRRVTIRPAPDTMCRLTALLPVVSGVAAYAALCRAADTCTAAGDARGRGQLMADTLVERLTGRANAGDVPVEVNLIMTDSALLHAPGESGHDEPAHLLGYGPIPAGLARRLINRAGSGTPRWLRRLYRHPETGHLVAMDSARRRFSAGQRRFIQLRDQRCRTPWCEAPIRHLDHVIPADRGGPTSISNAQGLCVACNYTKQAPGWVTRPGRLGAVAITTPTGHSYAHKPPDPPGTPRRSVNRRQAA